MNIPLLSPDFTYLRSTAGRQRVASQQNIRKEQLPTSQETSSVFSKGLTKAQKSQSTHLTQVRGRRTLRSSIWGEI